MTKQEEIREGLWSLFYEMGLGETIDSESFIKRILSYLHSQGCVIKVDRELPYIPLHWNKEITSALIDYKKKIEKAGYVAVEPLVRGK